MVRKYVRKKSARWSDKNKRAARAVELRSEGLTMRQIAERLAVSVGTVHADLTRWDSERENVTPLRSIPSFKSAPAGADLNTRSEQPDAEIVPLRRSS